MRWFLCSMLLFASWCWAAEPDPQQQWLAFKQAFELNASGPTGLYAIQDMQELQPGEVAYLPSGADKGDLRWSTQRTSDAVATVAFNDKQAIISGDGISTTDLMQAENRQLQLPNALTVRVSSLGEAALKVWLYNPDLPAQRQFKGLAYFPYDPAAVIDGVFRRNETPVAVNYLDSRDHAGVMYVVGTVTVQIDGQAHELRAFSYRNTWGDIEALLLLLKDQTSGKTTYGGGRVVEIHIPKGAPPATMTINLNTAYSFLCAHSEFYNCPLALTDRLDVALPYGEKYPPL